MRWLGRHLPNRLVAGIGEKASSASRDYTSQVKTIDSAKSIEKTRQHAAEAYKEKMFDIFVSGHTHVVEDSQQEGFRCINLGTWLSGGSVLELNQGQVTLVSLDSFLKNRAE